MENSLQPLQDIYKAFLKIFICHECFLFRYEKKLENALKENYTPDSSSFMLGNFIYSMASKPINILWIRTGSQLYLKIMYIIVLQRIFQEYQTKNLRITTKAFGPSGLKKTSFNLRIFYFNIAKICL